MGARAITDWLLSGSTYSMLRACKAIGRLRMVSDVFC